MKSLRLLFLVAFLISLAVFGTIFALRSRTLANRSQQTSTNSEKNDTVRVIVGLRLPSQFQPEGELSYSAAQTQRSQINRVRNQLLYELASYHVTVLSDSDQWIIPSVALMVDADALEYLMNSPEVTSIEEDVSMSFGVVHPRTK